MMKTEAQIRRGQKKMYKYTYKFRGLSIGCQPKGFIKWDHDLGDKFETIYYNRKLTAEEIKEYELIEKGAK